MHSCAFLFSLTKRRLELNMKGIYVCQVTIFEDRPPHDEADFPVGSMKESANLTVERELCQ